MLFYSNYNKEGQKVRMVIKEFISDKRAKINLAEVNYDTEKKLCEKYGVTGTPTLLFYINEKLVKRYFGEITYQEFESIIQNVLKQKGG